MARAVLFNPSILRLAERICKLQPWLAGDTRMTSPKRGTRTQILWCARCATSFVFDGMRVERAVGGKPAIRHSACSALNELTPNDSIENGRELWTIVGPIDAAH